jgi:hypothetical protein
MSRRLKAAHRRNKKYTHSLGRIRNSCHVIREHCVKIRAKSTEKKVEVDSVIRASKWSLNRGYR